MSGWSLALGIIGTLIALGGLRFTQLERRDRRLADAAERRARTEQIDLLRRQVEASERQALVGEAAQETARAAEVRVKRGGRDGLGWSFDLVKAGPGSAKEVKAWMIRAETGQAVSSTLELAGPLLPGEATSDRRPLIPLARELIEERSPLAVMLSWIDTREREHRDEHPVDL